MFSQASIRSHLWGGGGYPIPGGGGYPIPGLDEGVPCPRWGGTPSQVWMRGYPAPGGGTPSQVWTEGTPSQVWTGGYPIPGGAYPISGLDGFPISGLDGGVPHLWSGMGVPPSKTWPGTPLSKTGWGTHPPPPPGDRSAKQALATWQTVPLSFTQEDFLVISIYTLVLCISFHN